MNMYYNIPRKSQKSANLLEMECCLDPFVKQQSEHEDRDDEDDEGDEDDDEEDEGGGDDEEENISLSK